MGIKRGLLRELDRLEDVVTLEKRPFNEHMKHARELRKRLPTWAGSSESSDLWTLIFDAPPNIPEKLPDGWELDGKTLTVRY